MLSAKEFLKDARLNIEFKRPLIDALKPWKLNTYVDILVVVDTAISTDPVNDFGIASVIELIRNSAVGCMRFRVDIALRNGETPPHVVAAPTIHQPKYRGFRFNMMNGATSVIDKYEQIWCFGFNPSNSGNPSDAEIDQPGAFPASDAELLKLSQWMQDKKGGLFGTGAITISWGPQCAAVSLDWVPCVAGRMPMVFPQSVVRPELTPYAHLHQRSNQEPQVGHFL